MRLWSRITVGLILVAFLAAAGCGENEAAKVEPQNPRVVSTSPQAGAVDVNLNPVIRVWFDRDIDAASLDSAAFHVAGAVTERIDYDASEGVATLLLRRLLEPGTTYSIALTSGVTNAKGDSLIGDKVFVFTTGPMDCDHLEDYLEPNDVITEAADIDLAEAYPLLSSCSQGYNEYYRFVLQDTARVTARIEHVYSDEEQPMMYVRFKRGTDEAYTWYSGWFEQGTSINQRFTFLPGTYYLQTGSGAGPDRIVVYNLILQLSAPCLDDSLEDNDFIDEASSLHPGLNENLRGCYRDRDCFAVRLDSGNTLMVSVNQVPPTGAQCTLEIMGPGGDVLTGDDYTAFPAQETWTADQDTVYYIGATWWADNVRYTLELDVAGLP
jgi:hypothetical protein